MQKSTKIILFAVGAACALLLLIAGIGMLQAAPDPVAISDGLSGPVSDVWVGMTRAGWLLFACGAALTLFLVASVLRMVLGAFGDLASGIEWLVSKVRNSWYPPAPALETVLGAKNGKSFTLQDALQSANSKIKALESRLDNLEARTAHIEPPPPPPKPKTAEEIAAEQAELIANLQRKLDQMQKAQQAKSSEVAS